jgi:hypothetical protein
MNETATQAAIALAAVHNIDQEGYPSLAHTDISPAQYIKVSDVYKLNDFNRARFIAYDGNDACSFNVGSNPGRNRSPEEYNYQPQTEKVRRITVSCTGLSLALTIIPCNHDIVGGYILIGKHFLYAIAR